MDFKEEIKKIRKAVNQSSQILVGLKKDPRFDSVASGLALYLGLTQLGKSITIFCPEKIKVELANLVGIDKITDKIGGRDFIISLDYQEGSIDKVSYNIKDDKFNLVIKARPGAPKLTAGNVHYSHAGEAAELVFLIDVLNLQDLGKIYEEKKEVFKQEKIINLSSRSGNSQNGRINLVIPQAASTSEIIALVLKSLGVKLNQDMATNLLAGVISASKNFTSPQTNATTFEVAASCLRAGAKKSTALVSKIDEKVTPSFAKASEGKPSVAKTSEGKKEGKAPPDWLKPKIYKSSENSKNSTLL